MAYQRFVISCLKYLCFYKYQMCNLRHELLITNPKASGTVRCHMKIKGVGFKSDVCQRAL